MLDLCKMFKIKTKYMYVCHALTCPRESLPFFIRRPCAGRSSFYALHTKQPYHTHGDACVCVRAHKPNRMLHNYISRSAQRSDIMNFNSILRMHKSLTHTLSLPNTTCYMLSQFENVPVCVADTRIACWSYLFPFHFWLDIFWFWFAHGDSSTIFSMLFWCSLPAAAAAAVNKFKFTNSSNEIFECE